jgi:hypothetical protein
MTGNSIGADLMGRIKARAGDAERRSDTSAMAANSPSLEAMFDAIPKSHDPAVRAYLEGVNSPLKSMMVDSVAGDGGQARGLAGALAGLLGGKTMFGMMGGTTFSMGAGAPEVRPPASEAAVQAAEAALGFALPEGLRQLYLEVGDGGFGPGDGIYSLGQLVAKHREMTREPAGPQGQDWPAALLPIHGEGWDLISIDRGSGRLIFWDLEGLDDEDEDEGNAAWNASFVEEAPSLGAWLEKWLG